MGAIIAEDVLITEHDKERLGQLLADPAEVLEGDWRYAARLAEELEHAQVVTPDSMPEDLVTMNSTVRVRDLDTKQESVYTLVSPHHADAAHGHISVLAPIGTALLGYSEGDIVEWQAPSRLKRLQIVEVIFQPKATSATSSAGAGGVVAGPPNHAARWGADKKGKPSRRKRP